MTTPLLSQVDRYFAHDHKALRLTIGADHLARFEPAAVLAHPEGRAGARELAERLRASGWDDGPGDGPLHDLARGALLDRDAYTAALGDELGHRLLATGLARHDGGRLRLGCGWLALDDLVVPVPREAPAADFIYLGPEALYLEEVRAALGAGGRLAYLGCGAGHAATVLARHTDTVVATDLLPRAAAMTALAFAANATVLAASAQVVVADVAGPLRPAAFDLVVANPPWVPTDTGDTGRVFADGGPTGVELPGRFLAAAVDLLRPGGTAVVVTLDPTLTDGRRPLLRRLDEVVASATSRGARCDARVLSTPIAERRAGFEQNLLDRHPTLSAARHVAVVVRRHDGDPHAQLDPDALAAGLGPRWQVD